MQSEMRRVEPIALGWRRYEWHTGAFDAGYRPETGAVEGKILLPSHLVLVTLTGGARELVVKSACGHSYRGSDHNRAVSFLPAHCERTMQLRGVKSAWASIELNTAGRDGAPLLGDVPSFTNADDPFIAGLVAEFTRLEGLGMLEPLYCETMSLALSSYLVARYGHRRDAPASRPLKLAPWHLRRIDEFISAHLETGIRIEDLAALAEMSSGHFHRAFKATTGMTPLDYINGKRIACARQLLATEALSVTEVALRVGFQSPSYFAKVFRRATGLNPSDYGRLPE